MNKTVDAILANYSQMNHISCRR